MEEFLRFAKENPGKILGGAIGLLIAVIIVVFGFWRGIFIILCVLAGVLIGARVETNGGLRNLWDKFWFKRDHY
ncbi:MAG: DUF2273 domain-containing protein [Dethiobacteria bacterium]